MPSCTYYNQSCTLTEWCIFSRRFLSQYLIKLKIILTLYTPHLKILCVLTVSKDQFCRSSRNAIRIIGRKYTQMCDYTVHMSIMKSIQSELKLVDGVDELVNEEITELISKLSLAPFKMHICDPCLVFD
ncbi:unnamed protein product [Moneuplotes crassus]|uniref:Uncharacterized protein n=1 Tax=Euplotes crassus TaxID=5936 RepID=A0AAD1XFA8_EUPCR|nr:unnamed protein product [Moneuplotes crassus]